MILYLIIEIFKTNCKLHFLGSHFLYKNTRHATKYSRYYIGCQPIAINDFKAKIIKLKI